MGEERGSTVIRRKTVLELELPSGEVFEAHAGEDGEGAELSRVDGGESLTTIVLDRDMLKALLGLLDEARANARFGEMPPVVHANRGEDGASAKLNI